MNPAVVTAAYGMHVYGHKFKADVGACNLRAFRTASGLQFVRQGTVCSFG